MLHSGLVDVAVPTGAKMAAMLAKVAYGELSETAYPELWQLVGASARPVVVRAGNDVVTIAYDWTGSKVWIMVRGTDDCTDIMEDLQCTLDEAITGDVHHGFQTAAAELAPGIRRALEKMAPASSIHITGHSRGGAIAALLAPMLDKPLWSWRDPKVVVWTFGAPRFCNTTWLVENFGLDQMNLNAFENTGDIVPRIPPFTLGYASPNKWVLSKNTSKFVRAFPTLGAGRVSKVCKDLWTIARLAMFAAAPLLLAKRLKERHSMDAYVNSVTDTLYRQNHLPGKRHGR